MTERMMVGEENPNENSAKRRRAPSTIDLPATEVSSSAQSEQSAPPGEATSPRPSASDAPASRQSHDRRTQLIVAALAGAVVVLIAGGALWFAENGQYREALNERIAKLEARTVSGTPAPDTQRFDDLAARIGKIEAAAGVQNPASDAALGGRFDTLETAVKSLNDTVTKLAARDDDDASALREIRAHLDAAEQAVSDVRVTVGRLRDASTGSPEWERVNGRIASLEMAIKSVQQKIDPQSGATADNLVRRALLASTLREKAASGAPFATELAALNALGGEPSTPGALEPFAAKGLPTAAALCAELLPLLAKLNPRPDTAARNGTLMERLEASASHLIHIRPVGEIAGDDPAAILSRVEIKAARSDVEGVLADLQRLPTASREPLDEWIATAKSRQAALAAAQVFAAHSLDAVAQAAHPQ